jgi:hypothetical protein
MAIQEVAESSGWGTEFLALAARFDKAALARTMQDSKNKDLSDPSYNAADFYIQLAGGRRRWFASVLAVASVGLFVYLLAEGEKAELDYPFHFKGQAALWAVGIASVVWAAIAVVNWKSWLKRKRDTS